MTRWISAGLAAIAIWASITSATAQRSVEERRDMIFVCLLGDLDFVDRETSRRLAESYAHEGVSRREAPDYLDRLTIAERLRVMEQVKSCYEQLSRPASQARTNPRGSAYAELYLDVDPIAYTTAILCQRSDIRVQLIIAQRLLGQAGEKPPILQDLLRAEGFPVNPLDLDLPNLDCSFERICQLRGSVPIEILSGEARLYGIPARQVRALAGNCEGKVGYVNERFIDF